MRKITQSRLASRSRRGFTLPELMVSLVAGLVVTLAVVGLARTATTTFHEQVRSTASEMALRLAGQRFSADLERVGFMSTGNMRYDPLIVRLDTAPLPATGSRYLSLNNMAGIRLYVASAPENPVIAVEADNGLRPEVVDLTGNFTSNDQYIVATISAPPDPILSSCGPQSVTLNPTDAAVVRITRKILPDGSTPARSDGEATTLLQSIFQPGGGVFPARVLDPNSGATHFVIVNAVAVVGGVATITFAPSTGGCPVLWGGQGKGGTSGFGEGLQIAPLQTVRWKIQRVPNAQLDPPEDAPVKYDLTRQYVDAAGALVGAPEIVSEYAVDLKVAFTVDQTPSAPATLSFDYEDETNNQLWSTTGVNASARSAAMTEPAPHRIRSIRFRIAERTARSDRAFDLPGPAAGYLLRYCLDGAPLATCARWARVRTYTSEVALMNQARMSY